MSVSVTNPARTRTGAGEPHASGIQAHPGSQRAEQLQQRGSHAAATVPVPQQTEQATTRIRLPAVADPTTTIFRGRSVLLPRPRQDWQRWGPVAGTESTSCSPDRAATRRATTLRKSAPRGPTHFSCT